MKQHITVEQLWELSKNKNDWDSITRFNTIAKTKFNQEATFQACCETTAEQTTIGKMIEILEDKKAFNEYYDSGYFRETHNNIFLEWNGRVNGVELCDCLWGAVKKQLI